MSSFLTSSISKELQNFVLTRKFLPSSFEMIIFAVKTPYFLGGFYLNLERISVETYLCLAPHKFLGDSSYTNESGKSKSKEKNLDFFYSKMWRRSKDGLGKKL